MSELVKTGKEIADELLNTYDREVCLEETNKFYENKMYLVLPDGLDKLKEMLKKEFRYSAIPNFEGRFSSVFARFKKEQLEVKEK
jgi:hypothetical protein